MMETRLFSALINRLGEKIPHKSGRSLAECEEDIIVQTTVKSLIDLAVYKPTEISLSLGVLLDECLKLRPVSPEELPDPQLAESILLVTRVIGDCLFGHWRTLELSRSNSFSHSRYLRPRSGFFSVDSPHPSFTSLSIPELSAKKSQGEMTPLPSFGQAAPNTTSTVKVPKDPPAIDDSTCKLLLDIMMRCLQIILPDQPDTSVASTSAASLSSVGVTGPSTTSSSSSLAVASLTTILEIHRAAGRVVFYLSASNWNVVFTVFRNRALQLANTNDENMDTSPIQILQWCSLNSYRLSMIFTELNSSLPNFRKTAQITVASILHKAIWNWIEIYSTEFIQLCQSQKSIDGNPDGLFDTFNSLADNNKRKMAVWPTQTMLMILSPESLLAAVNEPNKNTAATKKAAFLDTLKKSMKVSRLADIVAVCFVDICRAATYVAKTDISALRYMVPEIEGELKEKLFDPAKPFTNADNVIDQGIMIDCFTALFRLNPLNTIRTIFPICMQENVPSVFRLVFIKSFYGLATQEHLPWNSTISSMSNVLSVPLRKLFHELVSKDKSDKKPDKKFKKSQDAAGDKSEIILQMLKLFQAEPKLAISFDLNENPVENLDRTIADVTSCLEESHSLLRRKAADTLLELFDPQHISQWAPSRSVATAFWQVSLKTKTSITRQIVATKDHDQLKLLLDVLSQLLIQCNEFLLARKDVLNSIPDVSDRISCHTSLEAAILISLCSSDPTINDLAIGCLKQVCHNITLIEDQELGQTVSGAGVADNLQIYIEICQSEGTVGGRSAQQKRLRRLLRNMQKPTAGNLGAWEEIYKRWKSMTALIVKGVDDTADMASEPKMKRGIFQQRSGPSLVSKSDVQLPASETVDKGQWSNYTGFLSALGVCNSIQPQHASNEQLSHRPSLVSFDSNQAVDRFLAQMVELLESDNSLINQGVREILGNELNSAYMYILLKHMEASTKKFFGQSGEVFFTDGNISHIEQSISILKLIVERAQDQSSSLGYDNFRNLVTSFTRYLGQMPLNFTSLRVKIRLCQLIETTVQKTGIVTMSQEIKFRNKLVAILMEWTSDLSMISSEQLVNEETSKLQKLKRDLDQSCLKAMRLLLFQLPVLPPEEVGDSDISVVKTNLFYKFFSFFLQLLSKCKVAENSQSKDSVVSIGKDLTILKEHAIFALSNLLSANIDIGLQFSLTMGYHEDFAIRTAFMQVLTNVLSQGAEFDLLAEKGMHGKYDKLVKMLLEGDLTLAVALCEVAGPESDEAADMLLSIFESQGRTMDLLKAVMEREIAKTDAPTTIFRRNSMGTKMLTMFSKIHGSEFLHSTLHASVSSVLENPIPFEVDPAKLKSVDERPRNLENLRVTTQKLVDDIFSSTSRMPTAFRHICHLLTTIVGTKFPDSSLNAVAGFIFLRFFCPAIVAPESSGLVTTRPTREGLRGLVLIAKTVQNLANLVSFGNKEEYMIEMNTVLEANIPRCIQFLKDISSVQQSLPNVNAAEVTPIDESDLARLHRFISVNMEKIGKELHSFKTKGVRASYIEDESTLGKSLNKTPFDRLSLIILALGEPPEQLKSEGRNFRRNTLKPAGTNSMYSEFMQRNAVKNLESVTSKKFFYDGGFSKERRHLYYFIARRLIPESVDMELATYHILQTMKAAFSQSYDVVVDLSFFEAINEISYQWMSEFLQLLFTEAIENLNAIYVLNCNSNFKKFFKNIPRQWITKLTSKVMFVSSVNELHEFINPQELKLPKTTLSLGVDAVVFSPVTRISYDIFRQSVPVILKVSAETIQVITLKKQDLQGMQVYLNDIWHIADLAEVVAVSNKQDEVEFVIKFAHGRGNVVLGSPKFEMISQAIAHAKAKLRLDSKPDEDAHRSIRPSDVPGTLLTMALLNIGSDVPLLRNASYDLLNALSVTFNFNVHNLLIHSPGLSVPFNNTAFATLLSRELSTKVTHFTLEFLSECCVGFTRASTKDKHLCLQFMTPWLLNLDNALHFDSTSRGKVKDILKKLVDLTMKEKDLFPAFQDTVWATLSHMDEDIVLTVMNILIDLGLEKGPWSSELDTASNTIVTLGYADSNLISGSLINRLRRAIDQISALNKKPISEHQLWNEIACLSRILLVVSFKNVTIVQNYLPEILYVILALVAVGPPPFRSTIHGLVVNIVHTLCINAPPDSEEAKYLNLLLLEFADPKCLLLFGLNRGYSGEPAVASEMMSEVPSQLELSAVATISNLLIDILLNGAHTPEEANAYAARFMSLIASAAFRRDLFVQPRAFIALGCLSGNEINDDCLSQVLGMLRFALLNFNEDNPELAISIIICLNMMIGNAPADSIFLKYIFWVAFSIIQIGDVRLFAAALPLVDATLRNLDSNGFFLEEGPSNFLMRVRQDLKEVGESLDTITGIHFKADFSFATAANLLKGIKNGETKQGTIKLLATFIEICRVGRQNKEKVESDLLGYVVPLIPSGSIDIKDILWLSGVSTEPEQPKEPSSSAPTSPKPQDLTDPSPGGDMNSEKADRVLDKLNISNTTAAVLVLSILVTILSNAEFESEQQQVYQILAEAAILLPEAFALVLELAVPRLQSVILTSQDHNLISLVNSILYTIVSNPKFLATTMNLKNSKRSLASILEALQFKGLLESGSFENMAVRNRKLESAKLAAGLVDMVLRVAPEQDDED